jgi:hypothetical protein
VRQAAESPNLEVNTRAERILAIVSRKSFEETIEAFLADESGQGGATLPGWERSRVRLGDNADARRLFAEMYRAEPVLMTAYGEDANATASSPSMEATAITSSFSIRVDELYDQHTQQNQINYQLRNQLKQTISDNVMALLFVGADQQIDIPRMNVTKFRMLFMQSWPAQRVAAAAERDRLRDWLAEWIVHRFSQPGREHEGITLGMQYDVPRTVELALRVLHRQENEPYVLMYAIPCVGKYGKDWHLTQLETLLSDEMVVHQRQQSVNGKVVQFETQLRDVALIVLLHRTEQAPQEYGFQEINQRADYLSLHHSFAFEDPKKREAAFRKWQAWRESHALFEGEPPRPKTKTETAKED